MSQVLGKRSSDSTDFWAAMSSLLTCSLDMSVVYYALQVSTSQQWSSLRLKHTAGEWERMKIFFLLAALLN
jgi:hypothetical protein